MSAEEGFLLGNVVRPRDYCVRLPQGFTWHRHIMAEHAEVFISGTTRDLDSYRREIKDALLALQIFPIEERNFALAYGPLVAMLRDLIGRCDAVIHLAGFYYGAEPPQRPPGETWEIKHQSREPGRGDYLIPM